MAKIPVIADVREINRYSFTVEVDDNLSPEEQKTQAYFKVKAHLKENCPYSNMGEDDNGVSCGDCEAGMKTEETISITII